MKFYFKHGVILIILFVVSCKKDDKQTVEPILSNSIDTLTQLYTFPVTLIGMDSVECGAEIIPFNQVTIYSAGLCWSKLPMPSINDSKITKTIIGGKFATSINGLLPGSTYYIRSFAITSKGTAYGPQRVFATDKLEYNKYVKGGLLFYVFQPGDSDYIEGEFHGLVSSGFLDFSKKFFWGKLDTFINATDSTSLYSKLNAIKVVSNSSINNSAALFCDSMILNGFSDWYIPNFKEAKLMRNNIGGITIWCSTEYDKDRAYTNSLVPKEKILAKDKILSSSAIRKF